MHEQTRILHLDVLRGLAVLGVLAMNIPDFAMPTVIAENSGLFEGTNSTNYKVYEFVYVFLADKMRGILSMLFGVSIILFSSKKEEYEGLSASHIYFRRMLWLLAICIFTSYIMLSSTLILYEYALGGILLYVFRNLNYKLFLSMGVICLAFYSIKMGSLFTEAKDLRVEYNKAVLKIKAGSKNDPIALKTINDWKQKQSKTIEEIKERSEYTKRQIHTFHSGYATIFSRVFDVPQSEFGGWGVDMLETLGTILLGMGLFRTRFLKAELPAHNYLFIAVLLIAAGTMIGYVRCGINTRADMDFLEQELPKRHFSVYHTEQFHRMSFILGYMALFIYFSKLNWFKFILNPLQSVGKMAISNYVFQNFICTLIFYGYGLDLYGSLERYELFYVVGIIWVIQISFSIAWLKYYSIGPLEWVWRSLIYWRRMPLRLNKH